MVLTTNRSFEQWAQIFAADAMIAGAVLGRLLHHRHLPAINGPSCRTPDADLDRFWKAVHTNLQAGKVRLVVVADVIPIELRTVVEFLNTQMDPAEVLAIELRTHVSEGLTTVVPTVMGQTAGAQHRKASTGTGASSEHVARGGIALSERHEASRA